jgi:hypothetical protein
MDRGGWIDGMRLDCKYCKDSSISGSPGINCCARANLNSYADFQQHKIWLVETAENEGHDVFFNPKFHCELNYIEMLWAYLKAYLRRKCEFNFNALQVALPDAIRDMPLKFVKRASRHCYRFISAYRAGLPAVLDL